MGRPLRIRYANTTYSDGVQEMSDADMNSTFAPILLTYIISNPLTSFGTLLSINTTPAGVANSVSIGTVYDVRNGNIGDHPVSNSTISTYTLYQSQYSQTPTPASRPVHYVFSGGQHTIQEMTNADIYTYIIAPIVQTMIVGGQGGYFLGTTSGGPPGTGTWVAIGTLADTYYDISSVLTTTGYTLWQRTTGSALDTALRPLRIDGTTFKQMSNTNIEGLSTFLGEYIRLNSIGQYAIQTSAPATGTWVSRGSYGDIVNNLSSVSYSGSYVGTYTGSYTTYYSGSYTQYYSGSYTAYYTGYYTSYYTGYYNRGGSTNPYTGTYYAAPSYAGAYATAYAGSYATAYAGSYASSYTGTYASSYTGTYSGTYTGVYSGLTTQTTTTTTTSTLWVRTA